MSAATGDTADTPDLLARMSTSAVDTATLEALRLTVDRLCADYPSVAAHQLLTESRAWLDRMADLLNHRLTLSQHREVLSMAGMLALLVGCLEQDTGASNRAEATRRSALSLGLESDDHDVIGWSYEMSAWFSLTRGDYRGVLTAADTGIAKAGDRSVSVQLFAQQAKAWARIGDRRRVEVALDQGRCLLERLPYPEDVQHHFVVDPHKWDFYAMDTYRLAGENEHAESLADEVLSMATDWTGRVISPMRAAEAHVTKGVVSARQGDLDSAISHGQTALEGTRQSVPSLVMVGKELGTELMQHYPNETEAKEYVDELRSLATTAA
ncbi:XRE family transcriptional regulator [Halostreptopolyspora alba]|uniref:XRE family transcriptional regulator n=1 Tax=Halostreptopolyspora alba TaxID=2487137 RepID=UPI00267FE44A